ncbi:hypothetical protein QAD02_015305 [Eretmocerus hayati]|uniref:Uncharacterized protein n=1 Tax=Eretmocerus hayati TaxID=131215 RepID=A0ACC2P8U5_9HYME|nr:hypothetical protein QAD02_015305 [Eretmocerus hayati]
MSQLPGWLWPTSNILPPLYKKIWDAVQDNMNMGSGVAHGEILVDTNKIFPLLLTSQLPTEVLGYIWSLANQKYAGQLTEQELYIVLALVALAQASYPFNSLEVLQHVRIPPTPTLNLALLDAVSVKSDVKLQQAPVQPSVICSLANKKSANPVRPSTNKPNSVFPSLDGSPQHNDISVKIQRFPAASSSNILNASLSDTRQAPTSQLDSRQQLPSLPLDSNDDFCDFQSAPIPNVSIVPVLDAKQGSAIGSRLANHNLGVKKLTDRVKKNGASRSLNNNQTRSSVVSCSMAPTREPQVIDHHAELFPKCVIRNQTKTVILKDTAIRSEPTEMIKPITKESLNVAEKVGPSTSTLPRPLQSKSLEPTDFVSVRDEKDMQPDLMSLQPSEDKYSALRGLVEVGTVTSPSHSHLEQNNVSCSPPADDFGDFISAEQTQPSPHTTPTSEDAVVISSIDLLSDFDFPTESIIDSNSKSSPSLVQEMSDAFNALAFGESLEKERKEKIESSLSTAEKIMQIEEAPSTNRVELKVPESLIRSGSVSSLDLKSILPSNHDDDQQIENMHQMIYWEWKQYMESCVLLLQIAAKIFTSITSELVLNEVLSSAQGYNFLVNLAEVAAVCRRVNFSHKEMDINIMGFDDLLLNIDRIWSEMEPFYTNIPIVTELPAWPAHQGDITCALCLTIITSGRLVCNDHNYHATCANLWLHAVNSNLPALRYPIPHLHSMVLQNSNLV